MLYHKRKDIDFNGISWKSLKHCQSWVIYPKDKKVVKIMETREKFGKELRNLWGWKSIQVFKTNFFFLEFIYHLWLACEVLTDSSVYLIMIHVWYPKKR